MDGGEQSQSHSHSQQQQRRNEQVLKGCVPSTFSFPLENADVPSPSLDNARYSSVTYACHRSLRTDAHTHTHTGTQVPSGKSRGRTRNMDTSSRRARMTGGCSSGRSSRALLRMLVLVNRDRGRGRDMGGRGQRSRSIICIARLVRLYAPQWPQGRLMKNLTAQ